MYKVWMRRLLKPMTCSLLFSAVGNAAQAESKASPPDPLITALLEPSLNDDGQLSSAEQAAIRQVAKKVLSESQTQELEIRMAAVSAAAGDGLLLVSATEPAPVVVRPEPCADATASPCCTATCQEGWLDNLSLYAGLDGSKQPKDLGVNAHMGGRMEVNWGFPLVESLGIGGQIGTGYNFYDNAVHVLDQVQGTNDSFQNFTTLGVFQRTEGGLNWGIAYDYLYERYYDKFHLGQWRGQVGYNVRPRDEIGVWCAVQDHGDQVVVLGTPLSLEPLSQANLYWRHTWCNRVQTTGWIGMAEGHGRDVFSISTEPPTGNVVTYGAEIYVPLSRCLAIYGAANFLTPADTGTVDAYLGIVFYPVGDARDAKHRRFAPLLPVANNPFFAVDLR